MKMMGKQKGGMMAGIGRMFGLGGGNPLAGLDPSKFDPSSLTLEQLKQLEQMSGGKLPPQMPQLPPGLGGAKGLPGLPGLGAPKGLPGLGGFNPFGGKKK
jgi:signal recognition particle subunit SRP54